jgi:hypothetical protein
MALLEHRKASAMKLPPPGVMLSAGETDEWLAALRRHLMQLSFEMVWPLTPVADRRHAKDARDMILRFLGRLMEITPCNKHDDIIRLRQQFRG